MKRRKFGHLMAGGLASALGLKSCHLLARSYSLVDRSVRARVSINWSQAIAKTTPLLFGSNDYEIIYPQRAADPIFQGQLARLNIPLIRIHHVDLSEAWTNGRSLKWDEAKIKAGYDVSYPHKPVIVQNIPRWGSWLKQDDNGLLAREEYENYANFCAELVRILNTKQQRDIFYWEPFNELDQKYQQAGKLADLWQIYNLVASKMKQVDERIKIGGPVLTWNNLTILESFLQSCSEQTDFISWHCYASGNATDSTAKIMAFTSEYSKQVKDFRNLVERYISDRQVPLFLSEYNINYSWDSGENRQNTHIGAVWFASVFQHLATANLDMAASWHLKDGIYGAIDPDNKLRTAATVFAWANRFLVGDVVRASSDFSDLEILAIESNKSYLPEGKIRQRRQNWYAEDRQSNSRDRSLLLINKSDNLVTVNMTAEQAGFNPQNLMIRILDEAGIKLVSANAYWQQNRLILQPYSLLLLTGMGHQLASD